MHSIVTIAITTTITKGTVMEDSSEAITTTMVVIEDVAITLAEEVTMETAAIVIARRAHSCRMMKGGRRRHRTKMQASRADRAFLKLTNTQSKDQRKPMRAVTQAAPTMYFQITTSTVERKASPEQPRRQEMLLPLAMVGHDYRRVPTPTCKRVARWETTRRRTRRWRRQAWN